MTVEKYIEINAIYESNVDKAEAAMKKLSEGKKHPNGMVFEEVRKSDEYKKAYKLFNYYFSLSREFAQTVPNKIKREAAMMKRAQKIKANNDKA